jgi:hypothetical protein
MGIDQACRSADHPVGDSSGSVAGRLSSTAAGVVVSKIAPSRLPSLRKLQAGTIWICEVGGDLKKMAVMAHHSSSSNYYSASALCPVDPAAGGLPLDIACCY